ncbi:hypothetical protein CASFOL_014602 [Castilleja foliolosa]|uniref:Uncharacterized protein n=1 Tax=Castilleja foliolosa TaxID=1961234 RepID=A0ABD3DQZ2_9LAMI
MRCSNSDDDSLILSVATSLGSSGSGAAASGGVRG